MKRALFAALAWLALCAPAGAVIGVTDLSGVTTTATTATITFSTTEAAGTLVIIPCQSGLSGNVEAASQSDSAGNTYLMAPADGSSSTQTVVLYAVLTNGITGGSSTITMQTSPSSSTAWTCEAYALTGTGTLPATASVYDLRGTAQTAGTTSETVTVPTLAQNVEFVLGLAVLSNLSGNVTTFGTGWAAPVANGSALTAPAQSSTHVVLTSYLVTASATGNNSFTPTWTSSRTNTAQIYAFKTSVSASTATPSALLTGIGP